MVSASSETSFPTILSNYDLRDIYKADEFGPFHQCYPLKTYQLKAEKCYGGKLSKICIAGMAATNVIGEKLPMFVIDNLKAI